MSAILSIRIDPETNKRLDALSKRSKRSKSLLASQAIAAFVETEEWQHSEIKSGIEDLDSGHQVRHARAARWLKIGYARRDQSAPTKVVWSRRAICHLIQLRQYIAKDSEQNAALVASRIL